MPTYGSYIRAAQAVYDGLTAANFPGGSLPPGPYLDEAPVTGSGGDRLPPPYVVIRDLGSEAQWTFTSRSPAGPGQNALVVGGFVLEAYALTLGDCDSIMAAVLWNGQAPNSRAGLAFAALSLTAPLRGLSVVPTKDQRAYAGYDRAGARVHVAKQWFKVTTSISGDGA